MTGLEKCLRVIENRKPLSFTITITELVNESLILNVVVIVNVSFMLVYVVFSRNQREM